MREETERAFHAREQKAALGMCELHWVDVLDSEESRNFLLVERAPMNLGIAGDIAQFAQEKQSIATRDSPRWPR